MSLKKEFKTGSVVAEQQPLLLGKKLIAEMEGMGWRIRVHENMTTPCPGFVMCEGSKTIGDVTHKQGSGVWFCDKDKAVARQMPDFSKPGR